MNTYSMSFDSPPNSPIVTTLHSSHVTMLNNETQQFEGTSGEFIDNNVATNQHVEEDVNANGDVIGIRKKRKTSFVWDHFKQVQLKSGILKNECIHCKKKYAADKTKATSHLKRHLEKSCPVYKTILLRQKRLNLSASNLNVDSNILGSVLVSPGVKCDSGKLRESIAHWVMMHEHAFSIVEELGFILMMKCNNPEYEKIGRKTLKSDCVAIYEAEKMKLKSILRFVNKISLTTDLWKSQNQKIEYMVLTAHYIDVDWVLQKRILSFVHVPPPRRGIDIADAIFKCLKEWGIENKVFTISVDNAAYIDKCLKELKIIFSRQRKLVCEGKLFHVRCCAHILNLLVQDGLGTITKIIENVRESVKFINQSEARLRTFSEIVQQLELGEKKLILDCPTRWNSTYQMLSTALQFKEVFPRFQDQEPTYQYLPELEELEKIQKVTKLLEVFNAVTNIISGSDYPTANLYLTEVYRVKQVLDEATRDESTFIQDMAVVMKEKFDKYWSECNLVMALANILDPRCKMMGVRMCFPLIYPGTEAKKNIEMVQKVLYDMYEEYVDLLKNDSHDENYAFSHENSTTTMSAGSSGWSMLMNYVREQESAPVVKSEIEVYLEEPVYIPKNGGHTTFCTLGWWKVNSSKFQILSRMAADVLAIPISTVASESTFSAGGRVIDSYRASLNPKAVQALICGGDWMRVTYGIKKKPKVEEHATEIKLLI